MKRFLKRLLSSILALSLSACVPSLMMVRSGVQPSDAVRWSAGHETGDLSEWRPGGKEAVFNTGTGRVKVSDAHARTGRYSLELSVTDSAAQTQAARIFQNAVFEPSRSPRSAYFSAWFYFPRSVRTEANWWNVLQFKSRTDNRNDPTFVLNVDGSGDANMSFYLFSSLSRQSYPASTPVPIPLEQWVHVEIKYTASPFKNGAVQVWQDGAELLNVQGVQTNYADALVDFSINNYGAELSPDPTIYVDDVAISSERLGEEIFAEETEPVEDVSGD